MKILQCDSRGDKRFSPFFCTIDAFGVIDSIENHYQKAKVFVDPEGPFYFPKDWRQAKGLKKDGLLLHDEIRLPNGKFCPGKFLVFGWYSSLWLKYLDQHPELVEIAAVYDDYSDRFKHDFPLCQADCIRLYVKQGRHTLLAHCKEFFEWLKINS